MVSIRICKETGKHSKLTIMYERLHGRSLKPHKIPKCISATHKIAKQYHEILLYMKTTKFYKISRHNNKIHVKPEPNLFLECFLVEIT